MTALGPLPRASLEFCLTVRDSGLSPGPSSSSNSLGSPIHQKEVEKLYKNGPDSEKLSFSKGQKGLLETNAH